MRDQARLQLIQQIEESRGSRVVAWLMGDRKHMETKIATDQFSLLYDHLVSIGKQKQIDLFLYGPGGLTQAGFGAVNLLREFCDRLTVLVPFRAMSTMTLICLGADEIVMGRLGQLSPIDPTITSPYNPPAPGPAIPGVLNLLPLSVEDVGGYLNLAEEDFGLEEESSRLRVLETLALKVNPIALGSVYRSRKQIGMLAKKLLTSHADSAMDMDVVKNVVSTLSRELGSHDYIISRHEAKSNLKLPVLYPDDTFEALMWDLFKKYQEEMNLNVPYNPESELGEEQATTVTFRRAFMESASLTHVFETTKVIRRVTTVQQGVELSGFQETVMREGWVEYR